MTRRNLHSDSDCVVPWPTGGTESDRLLALLGEGEINLMGLMPWSSNYTFLGEVTDGTRSERIVYKPIRGERPLWDFPKGTLAKREVAAFVVCRALGWDFVPPTVLRGGPHGRGSVQLFVECDQDEHFFTFRESENYRHSLKALTAFDIIANNADRKGGHCLRTGDGCIVAIDQGLCFHTEPKLRTVIWDFAGEEIPVEIAACLQHLSAELARPESGTMRALTALLYGGEIAALRRRVDDLVLAGCFPDPPEDRRPYPWPLV
jgi:uncharacterized repeat protein (TIGR03843 family)